MRFVRVVSRWAGSAALGLAVVLGTLLAWARLSPRPGVALINWLFSLTDTGEVKGMEATGVVGRTDLAYGSGPDEVLDVWAPAGGSAPLPVIVWVHGGAWIGGDKSQPAPYLRLLAQHGYVGVAIGYSLAPDHPYPRPVRQLGAALAWIGDHADELGVDPTRVVLAGDSAGAHIAGQYAALVSDPGYADRVGISPRLEPEHLVGTMLHCGPYDPPAALRSRGVGGWFVRTVGWAYLGTKDLADPRVRESSVLEHATPAYPPTLLSGGEDDPLTRQGRAFAERLAELGVDHETYFPPGLHHEFQFDLTRPEARRVLTASTDFLARVTAKHF